MIVIIDKAYAEYANGDLKENERADGSGVFAEYNRISNRLYALGRQPNTWLVPVLFQDGNPVDIPGDIAVWTYVTIDSRTWKGVDRLVQRLHDISPVVLPDASPDAPRPLAPRVLSPDPVD